MLVLGHRGWPLPEHPENTLAAVDAALTGGADGVEVDVHLTADGVAVCCHDDDLTRVGGALPSVRRATQVQLARVRLPGGHRVPRLAEVLALAAGRGTVVLDLKPEPRVDALLGAVLDALATARVDPATVVVSSFDDRLLQGLAVRRPGMPRAALLEVDDPLGPALERAARRGDAAVHLPLGTVLAAPEAVAGSPVPVRAWTVNKAVDAQLCALLGVAAVITDVPGLLARERAAAA